MAALGIVSPMGQWTWHLWGLWWHLSGDGDTHGVMEVAAQGCGGTSGDGITHGTMEVAPLGVVAPMEMRVVPLLGMVTPMGTMVVAAQGPGGTSGDGGTHGNQGGGTSRDGGTHGVMEVASQCCGGTHGDDGGGTCRGLAVTHGVAISHGVNSGGTLGLWWHLRRWRHPWER